MNTPALTCTTATIEALLGEALEPTTLEVIDESADHIGHAGSNGQGVWHPFPYPRRQS